MLAELESYYDLLSYIYIHIYMCVLCMCIHKYSLANNVKPSTFKCQADRVVRRFDFNHQLTESRIPWKIDFWVCEWAVIFMSLAAREHSSQLWVESYTGILDCRVFVEHSVLWGLTASLHFKTWICIHKSLHGYGLEHRHDGSKGIFCHWWWNFSS